MFYNLGAWNILLRAHSLEKDERVVLDLKVPQVRYFGNCLLGKTCHILPSWCLFNDKKRAIEQLHGKFCLELTHWRKMILCFRL